MIRILINEKTQTIFWFLWRNRREPYTIREIARQTKISYGSTWSILKGFEELGLVYGIEKRKAHLYVLNFDHRLCFQVWSLLNALRREKITLDTRMREATEKLEEGFIVYYSVNGTPEMLCISKKGVKGIKTIDPEEFRDILKGKKDFYSILWNEGICLAGEKEFYTLLWGLAEKKVIGVGT